MLQVETETAILTSLNFESETKTGVAIYKSTAKKATKTGHPLVQNFSFQKK